MAAAWTLFFLRINQFCVLDLDKQAEQHNSMSWQNDGKEHDCLIPFTAKSDLEGSF